MWAYSLLRFLSSLAVLSFPLLTGCMAQYIRADKVAGPTSNQIAPIQGCQGFLRGVNIGGWLVLENWLDLDMTSDAPDEFIFPERARRCVKTPDSLEDLLY